MPRTVHETKEFIEQSLALFHEELARIDPSEKKALQDAEKRCPGLLDNAFKLQFLRTDLFDAQLAAKRFVLHWRNRLELFGPERAFLPMTLDGAMKDDIETLSKGYIRMVPGHERAFFIDHSCYCKKTDDVDAVARTVWYIQSRALLRSEELQKHGAIFIFDVGQRLDACCRRLFARISHALTDAFPLRGNRLYVVNAPRLAYTIYNVFKLFLKPSLRDRVIIYGNVKKLETRCGIKTASASIFKHWEWIETVRLREAN